MTGNEIIVALTIHLIVPMTGLICFLKLKKQMKAQDILSPPTIELLIIFATYGGLLLVILTTLFWQWSGMASLGIFYLILGAPIVMGIIAFRQRQTKKISKYHEWTYNSAMLYSLILPVILFALFLVSIH